MTFEEDEKNSDDSIRVVFKNRPAAVDCAAQSLLRLLPPMSRRGNDAQRTIIPRGIDPPGSISFKGGSERAAGLIEPARARAAADSIQ